MGKQWTAADLPAGATGYTSNAAGDLLASFPDGRTQMLEAGYQKRALDEAIAANKIANVENARRDAINQAATPPTPAVVTTAAVSSKSEVKSSERDSILFNDDSLSITEMETLFFENIGGHELLNISRRDTINGQKVLYQPIKNLTEIEQRNNPGNIINLPSTSDKYFANFPIKLDAKIPVEGSGPNKEYLYISRSTGDLIVDVVNLEVGEEIEIQIAAGGTIYEAEI